VVSKITGNLETYYVNWDLVNKLFEEVHQHVDEDGGCREVFGELNRWAMEDYEKDPENPALMLMEHLENVTQDLGLKLDK